MAYGSSWCSNPYNAIKGLWLSCKDLYYTVEEFLFGLQKKTEKLKVIYSISSS